VSTIRGEILGEIVMREVERAGARGLALRGFGGAAKQGDPRALE